MTSTQNANTKPHGAGHWIAQRATAIFNLGLMIWLVVSVLGFGAWDHATFTAWLAQPLNVGLMIAAIISTFYHAALGAEVIAEDYIQNQCLLTLKVTATKTLFLALATAGIFSILKIAFWS